MTKLTFAAGLLWCGMIQASPQAVADSACPKYAVDIAAFATCEGDRVVAPDGEVPLRPLVDDNGLAVPASPAAAPRDPRSRSAAGLYLTPIEARAFKRWLGDSVLFVDVRAGAAVAVSGLAEAADLNIPLEGNGGFGQQVARQHADQTSGSARLIFLICQDGRLAARAADLLTRAGLPNAYVVRGGVDGLERDARREEMAMAR